MEGMINGAVIILFLLGLFGLLTQKNLLKIVICFNIMEGAILIFLVAMGYRPGGTYPIVRMGSERVYADPLPQALALTAIVIGASMTALMLAFIIKIYKQYGTLDIDELRRLKG